MKKKRYKDQQIDSVFWREIASYGLSCPIFYIVMNTKEEEENGENEKGRQKRVKMKRKKEHIGKRNWKTKAMC